MFSDNNMVMPVTPSYGGACGNGFLGGDGIWALLIFAMIFGGWGGGFGGFNGMADGSLLYPWMNQAEVTTSGFQNAATNNAISTLQNGVTSGFADIQNALCNGFAQTEIGANSRQMANMNQMFGLQSSLQNCCCENRLATANLGADIAREACATRTNDTSNTQAIINTVNAGVQSIKDQICNDKIDAKNEKIVELQNQLNMETLKAYTAQGLTNEVDALYNRLKNCPVGTYNVTNPLTPTTCGCGM